MVFQILGLDICANTIVGDELQRGISGGQKKRVTTGNLIFFINYFFILLFPRYLFYKIISNKKKKNTKTTKNYRKYSIILQGIFSVYSEMFFQLSIIIIIHKCRKTMTLVPCYLIFVHVQNFLLYVPLTFNIIVFENYIKRKKWVLTTIGFRPNGTMLTNGVLQCRRDDCRTNKDTLHG